MIRAFVPPGPFKASIQLGGWGGEVEGVAITGNACNLEIHRPADGKVNITSLAENTGGIAGKIESISLLGNPQSVKFTRGAQGLQVTLPAWKPSDFASVLKITGLIAP